MGALTDFIGSFAEGAFTGYEQSQAAGGGIFGGYEKGTEKKFKDFLAGRQATVEASFSEYKKKFDHFENAAKDLAGLYGEGADPTTQLSGMEAAALSLKGKTTEGAAELVSKLKAMRDEGTDIRAHFGPSLARNEATREVKELTASTVAKMTSGGGFKYQKQPFNFKDQRSPVQAFLRDNFDLYRKTDEEWEGKRDAERTRFIRSGLPNYDKYAAGETPVGEARSALSFDPRRLRTQEQNRAEQRSILTLNAARDNAQRANETLNSAEVKEQRIKSQIIDAHQAGNTEEVGKLTDKLDLFREGLEIAHANSYAANRYGNGVTANSKQLELLPELPSPSSTLYPKAMAARVQLEKQLENQAVFNAVNTAPPAAQALIDPKAFPPGAVSHADIQDMLLVSRVFRKGREASRAGDKAWTKVSAGIAVEFGESATQEQTVKFFTLAKKYLPPDQYAALALPAKEAPTEQGTRIPTVPTYSSMERVTPIKEVEQNKAAKVAEEIARLESTIERLRSSSISKGGEQMQMGFKFDEYLKGLESKLSELKNSTVYF